MKLTKEALKQIIKEELDAVMNEQDLDEGFIDSVKGFFGGKNKEREAELAARAEKIKSKRPKNQSLEGYDKRINRVMEKMEEAVRRATYGKTMSRGLADLVGFRYDSDLNDQEDRIVDVPGTYARIRKDLLRLRDKHADSFGNTLNSKGEISKPGPIENVHLAVEEVEGSKKVGYVDEGWEMMASYVGGYKGRKNPLNSSNRKHLVAVFLAYAAGYSNRGGISGFFDMITGRRKGRTHDDVYKGKDRY